MGSTRRREASSTNRDGQIMPSSTGNGGGAVSPKRLRKYSAPFACEGGSERSERGMRAERRENRAEGLADARHPPGSLRSPTPLHDVKGVIGEYLRSLEGEEAPAECRIS
jgi:hypothetical protein